MFVPLRLAAGAVSGAASLGFLYIAYNWIKNNCTCFRKADIRRIWGVGYLFLKLGIDQYPEFPIIFTAHSVKDLETSSKVYATLYAKYENFKTRTVSTGKWEQSARLTVPQGTSELEVSVYSTKLLSSDTLVGSFSISISKYFMGQFAADFFGKKKWHKLFSDEGASVGQISFTFRKGSDSLEEEVPLISGLDPDQRPALYGELVELFDEKAPRNVRGEDKLLLLAKVLQGKLQRVGRGLSGSADCYCAVVKMAPPGDSDSSEGGNRSVTQKWFWAWYSDKKDFLADPTDPEGCVPLLSITAVHFAPDKPGEFTLRYVSKPDKKKKETTYKSTDKDVEVWSDGIEMLREEAREVKALVKAREEEWSKLDKSQKMEEWMSHYRTQGYSDEELKKYYQQYQLALMTEPERKRYLEAMAVKANSIYYC